MRSPRSRRLAPFSVLLLCVWAGLVFCSGGALAGTATPIVGILGVPGSLCVTASGAFDDDGADGSCFDVFYSRWLEAAGARVIGIPYTANETELAVFLGSLNGILFTGGGLSLGLHTRYYETARRLYDGALERQVPLWGTCMGFQLLCILGAGDDESVLEHNAFDAEDLSLALQPSAEWADSTFVAALSTADPRAPSRLTSLNITSNLHHDGVPPSAWTRVPKLASSFHILSTNQDRRGKEFVSTIEAPHAPVFGTQWHPERPQFEFRPQNNISHSPEATQTMAAVAQLFLHHARQSNQSFSPQTLPRAQALSVNAMRTVVDGQPLEGVLQLHF